ncbi:MAG: hypothetical protein JW983_04235 [Elusimicrobia bacterium]|nr:hypothetical protein [Elusimicrobiota bacterium]
MSFRTILGIGDFVHDNGIAIVRDGKLIFAVNEERLSKNKLDQNIDFCLTTFPELSKIQPPEIDAVALAGVHPVRFFLLTIKEFFIEMGMRKSLPAGFILRLGKCLMKFLYVRKVKSHLKRLRLNKKPFYYVDHHLTHAAGTFYSSGYEEATILTTDGFGDGISATIYLGKNNKLKRLKKIFSLNSPGLFYTAVTSYLGFKPLQHEGKITGLAAYGENSSAYEFVRKIISFDSKKCNFPIDLKYFRSIGTDVSLKEIFSYLLILFTNTITQSFSKINRILSQKRSVWHSDKLAQALSSFSRENVSWAFQQWLEEIMADFAEYAVDSTGIGAVAVAGGTFANVKVNQKIGELPGVKKIFVYPHMGDGGTAGGAALYIYHKLTEYKNKVKAFETAYLGPGYPEDEILKAFTKYSDKIKWEKADNMPKQIAAFIAEKKIVGRYSGRMEYGPRALGNRSILVHPSDKTINDWLNKRLKRTEFMPFAPVTLKEKAGGSYIIKSGCEEPAEYMTITFFCSDFMQKNCAAAVHVDGTARPQIIDKDKNKDYYNILQEFYNITNIPSFINTSFNMHESPIICTPEDAIQSFLQGAVDILSLENYIVFKK